ncbi:hypothetical protein [Sansalvadorimonas verongulae]|uniref:hypothetical protein n=1 Tax=Sansalvadorimonas verongulae TaxID=2172824 RepID=UPI0012BBBDEB|nr:hypothetical protein [Sansalvadorimonas verongulae]MTI15052.1 hypothetical protein [Sansalvadorimonas verongulae]
MKILSHKDCAESVFAGRKTDAVGSEKLQPGSSHAFHTMVAFARNCQLENDPLVIDAPGELVRQLLSLQVGDVDTQPISSVKAEPLIRRLENDRGLEITHQGENGGHPLEVCGVFCRMAKTGFYHFSRGRGEERFIESVLDIKANAQNWETCMEFAAALLADKRFDDVVGTSKVAAPAQFCWFPVSMVIYLSKRYPTPELLDYLEQNKPAIEPEHGSALIGGRLLNGWLYHTHVRPDDAGCQPLGRSRILLVGASAGGCDPESIVEKGAEVMGYDPLKPEYLKPPSHSMLSLYHWLANDCNDERGGADSLPRNESGQFEKLKALPDAFTVTALDVDVGERSNINVSGELIRCCWPQWQEQLPGMLMSQAQERVQILSLKAGTEHQEKLMTLLASPDVQTCLEDFSWQLRRCDSYEAPVELGIIAERHVAQEVFEDIKLLLNKDWFCGACPPGQTFESKGISSCEVALCLARFSHHSLMKHIVNDIASLRSEVGRTGLKALINQSLFIMGYTLHNPSLLRPEVCDPQLFDVNRQVSMGGGVETVAYP